MSVLLSQAGTFRTFSCHGRHHTFFRGYSKIPREGVLVTPVGLDIHSWGLEIMCWLLSGTIDLTLSAGLDLYIKGVLLWKEGKGLLRQNSRRLLHIPWHTASEVLHIVTYLGTVDQHNYSCVSSWHSFPCFRIIKSIFSSMPCLQFEENKKALLPHLLKKFLCIFSLVN